MRVAGPEPVDLTWGPDRDWKTAVVMPWKWREHNTIGELRCVAVAFERICRMHPCTRVVVMTDAFAAIGAVAKGRSSSGPMRKLCRRILSLSVASGCRLYMRYVPTWLNCADGPSRGLKFPSVAWKTIAAAGEKYRMRDDKPESLIYALANFGPQTLQNQTDAV